MAPAHKRDTLRIQPRIGPHDLERREQIGGAHLTPHARAGAHRQARAAAADAAQGEAVHDDGGQPGGVERLGIIGLNLPDPAAPRQEHRGGNGPGRLGRHAHVHMGPQALYGAGKRTRAEIGAGASGARRQQTRDEHDADRKQDAEACADGRRHEGLPRLCVAASSIP